MATDYTGFVEPVLSGQVGVSGARIQLSVSTTASAARSVPQTIQVMEMPLSDIAGQLDRTDEWLINRSPSVDRDGLVEEAVSLFWFEMLHTYPSFIELGNMASSVARDIEIYSSFRRLVQTLDTAVNNAGTGITFQNLPTLPANINPNGGIVFQVLVSQQGQPEIDGTLDFTTSVDPLSIPITGSRVIIMANEPEGDIQETLEFLTDIIRSVNGKEQRIKVRKNPRQTFDYNFRIPEGEERRKLEIFLTKWHPQVFGIPVWTEAKRLSSAATAGDLTINVNTDYADFRTAGLAIVWSGYDTFDALEIQSMTSSTITFSSPITRDYPAKTKVMPLRLAITKQDISGDKAPVNMSFISIRFFVNENESSIADDSAFGSHNGKVMFNDYNWIPRETNTDTLKRILSTLDNQTGDIIQFSDWDHSHFISSKGFFCRNPQATWEMRQVLHFLGGRWKSFYLPTFYYDLIVNTDLASGSSIMDIDYVGYTDFINGNEPNKSLYVVLNDGTIYTRQVESSSIVSETTERLVLDEVWPANIPYTDIKFVSFLRLGRFANDQFEINHNNSGQATLKATVQGVLQ